MRSCSHTRESTCTYICVSYISIGRRTCNTTHICCGKFSSRVFLLPTQFPALSFDTVLGRWYNSAPSVVHLHTRIRAPPPLTSALRRAIPTITAPRHRRRRGPLLHLLLVLLLFVWCPAALSTIPLSPLSLLLLPRVMLQLSWAVAIPPSAQCHIRRILIRLTPSLRPLPLSMAVPATVKMLHLLREARRILK